MSDWYCNLDTDIAVCAWISSWDGTKYISVQTGQENGMEVTLTIAETFELIDILRDAMAAIGAVDVR
jgi:hypothetical protein